MNPRLPVLVTAAVALVGCGSSSSKPSATATAPASASAPGTGAVASAAGPAATSGGSSAGGSSGGQPVLTSAQTCAKVTPASLQSGLGGSWGDGKPETGYVGCEYKAQAGGAVYLTVDQEARKLPPAQAAQFASQVMHADEEGTGWVKVPGLGDEADFNSGTGTLVERIAGSSYRAQVLKDGGSTTHDIADSRRVLALLTAS